MTGHRLTDAARVALQALLDANTLERNVYGVLPPQGGIAIDLPADWTEPIPPPLPAGPEPGVYMLGENAEVGQCYVWVYGPGANVMVFYYGGHSGWIPWAEAWELAGGEGVAIRRLVPAPEPVTLPWMSDGRGLHVYIDSGNVAVRVAADPRYTMRSDTARAMAAALLSAADQAEGAKP